MAVAWFGAILEAVADAHKLLVNLKNKPKAKDEDKKIFQGPSTGVYRFTRHPNYTGEILVWLGFLLAGAPTFGRSVIAWLCSSAGLYGITFIMRASTSKLEEKQAANYGGQTEYENWKKKVPAPLFPFVKG